MSPPPSNRFARLPKYVNVLHYTDISAAVAAAHIMLRKGLAHALQCHPQPLNPAAFKKPTPALPTAPPPRINRAGRDPLDVYEAVTKKAVRGVKADKKLPTTTKQKDAILVTETIIVDDDPPKISTPVVDLTADTPPRPARPQPTVASHNSSIQSRNTTGASNSKPGVSRQSNLRIQRPSLQRTDRSRQSRAESSRPSCSTANAALLSNSKPNTSIQSSTPSGPRVPSKRLRPPSPIDVPSKKARSDPIVSNQPSFSSPSFDVALIRARNQSLREKALSGISKRPQKVQMFFKKQPNPSSSRPVARPTRSLASLARPPKPKVSSKPPDPLVRTAMPANEALKTSLRGLLEDRKKSMLSKGVSGRGFMRSAGGGSWNTNSRVAPSARGRVVATGRMQPTLMRNPPRGAVTLGKETRAREEKKELKHVVGAQVIRGVRPNGYVEDKDGTVKPIVTVAPKGKVPHNLRQNSLEKIFEAFKDAKKLNIRTALSKALRIEQEIYVVSAGRSEYRDAVLIKLKALRG